MVLLQIAKHNIMANKRALIAQIKIFISMNGYLRTRYSHGIYTPGNRKYGNSSRGWLSVAWIFYHQDSEVNCIILKAFI